MSRSLFSLSLPARVLLNCSASALGICVCLLLASNASATTILSDNFSTSTVPISPTTYPTPTATSTGYAIASTKNQSPAPSIATGDLKFGIAKTSSGFEQTQALFTTSPVTLTNTGDFVEMQVNFHSNGPLTSTATLTGTLNFGMYSSGGSAPKTDLSASGIITTNTTDATGGTQNWAGYVSRLFQTGGSNPSIYTRTAQGAADSSNQDLLFNAQSGTVAYHSPGGTSLGTTGTNITLNNTDQYLEDFTITLTAAGTYTITSVLTDVSTSTTLSSQSDTATGGNFFNVGFDGLAIGYRETANIAATALDLNSLTVLTNVATVPEPASVLLLSFGGAALGLAALRRAKV